eukprot:CAMPEP_0114692958 /NCGR_PEP_ID=MMETSP0191-20121206/68515_1 /TAXON_ID=126664 /ORGANISM="Sorites sp." /LENGTH=55 /DNA_ID=CAMNT_0001985995 /DNA_START=618 /DNA_END=785 /DNA_ORIENTATION=+
MFDHELSQNIDDPSNNSRKKRKYDPVLLAAWISSYALCAMYALTRILKVLLPFIY